MGREKLRTYGRYDVFKLTGKSCSICDSHYANCTEYDDERKGYSFLCGNCGVEIAFLKTPKPYIEYKKGE